MDTRTQMNRAQEKLSQAQSEVLKASQTIFNIQAACEHHWVFSKQINAYHKELWWVFWKCEHCDLERNDKMAPICTECHQPLKHTTILCPETEAEKAKRVRQIIVNPPEVWHCATCDKIHTLHTVGD